MGFKIEIYHYARKSKHKLYDSQAQYDRWWDERKKDVDRWLAGGRLPSGLKGYVDGILDREYGDLTTTWDDVYKGK